MNGKVIFRVEDDGEKTHVSVEGKAQELVVMIGNVLNDNKDLLFLMTAAIDAVNSGVFNDENTKTENYA